MERLFSQITTSSWGCRPYNADDLTPYQRATGGGTP